MLVLLNLPGVSTSLQYKMITLHLYALQIGRLPQQPRFNRWHLFMLGLGIPLVMVCCIAGLLSQLAAYQLVFQLTYLAKWALTFTHGSWIYLFYLLVSTLKLINFISRLVIYCSPIKAGNLQLIQRPGKLTLDNIYTDNGYLI